MKTAAIGQDRTRALLWAEFVTIFGLAPVAVAVALPASAMFPALAAVTALGLYLLWRTPGFRWAGLLRGRVRWGEVALFAALCMAVSWAVVQATAPRALFGLIHYDTMLWLMVMAFYPILSALPQELVFRPLFFRRYGQLLPGQRAAVVLNAALFSLAHLMYWNWIVAVMTFFGGLAFAHAYEVRRSFPQAVVMHAVAGWVLFSIGLGMFFYTGNVTRPF